MSLLARLHNTRLDARSITRLFTPLRDSLDHVPALESQGNRPLQMTFEDQLKILTYYHPEEHSSGRHLLQVLAQVDFTATHIAPPDGIQKSAFFEAINSRSLEQMVHAYEDLQKQATAKLPIARDISDLGDLIAVDGSLIDATLSMLWADYRQGAKKSQGPSRFRYLSRCPAESHSHRWQGRRASSGRASCCARSDQGLRPLLPVLQKP